MLSTYGVKLSLSDMHDKTQADFSQFLMVPYVILKICLIRKSDKLTNQYVGLGVRIIFHPLANEPDTSLSQNMEC